MQRVFLIVLLMLWCLFPATSSAKLKVVATLADLGWIVEQVGGPEVEVLVLCPGHRDPHSLPAKPSLARKLGKADLLVYNGLDLEVGWLPLLVDAARNPRIKAGQIGELDCSLALAPDDILGQPHGEVDRSHGDIHPLGNPHYLLDPGLGIKVAHLIAHRLADLDPGQAEAYAHRADDLANHLETRFPAWQERVAGLSIPGLILYHQQWEYLAHWLDLDILATVENRPGISPSPRHVEGVVQLGRATSGIVLLAAAWDHADGARHVADKIPCPLVTVSASSGVEDVGGYSDLFAQIVAGLEGARP